MCARSSRPPSSSASEIQRGAEDDAREIRDEAAGEANATRENAHREARDYLDKVSASTSAMMERLNAMEQEMNAMIESVRTGSGRLTADLQQLETGLSDVSSAIAPRPAFVPDEPAADSLPGARDRACTSRRPCRTTSRSPSRRRMSCRSPSSRSASSPAAEEPAVEAMPQPEAAELESVAGDGHTNGFDQPQPAQQGGDAEGARLIALNMALNGTPREETARYLSENFHLADAGGLLDEVYASVES